MTDVTSKGPSELKEGGNTHFKAEEYKLASEMYKLALSRAERKEDKLPLHKNLAACYLKMVRTYSCVHTGRPIGRFRQVEDFLINQ